MLKLYMVAIDFAGTDIFHKRFLVLAFDELGVRRIMEDKTSKDLFNHDLFTMSIEKMEGPFLEGIIYEHNA